FEVSEILRQARCCMRVMPHVQYHSRPTRKDLKTTRQLHPGQSATNRAVVHWQSIAQCVERSERGAGVGELIIAAQSGPWQPVALPAPVPKTPLHRFRRKPEVAIDQMQVCADTMRVLDQGCGWICICNDGGSVGPEDPSLLEADALAS